MSIAVWADVGGTFTDCLIRQDGQRKQIKVLSSGKVRLRLRRIENGLPAGRLRCHLQDAPPGGEVDFWLDANAAILTHDGSHLPIGRITAQHGNQLEISPHEGAAGFELGQADELTLELDARLQAAVLATRILLGVPLSKSLPPLEVRLGTTRGTNALLTRSGARTGLLVTAGFGDVLNIGEQDRPDLFALAIEKYQPLAESTIEIQERLDHEGNILQPIDRGELQRALRQMKDSGIESVAICFLHAHVNDRHEKIAEQVATALGFQNVSRSSEVAPLIKLVHRAETTSLDAYLNPILSGYVQQVWEQFGGSEQCRLRLMTSAGNLVAPTAFRGRDSILSGPAGGVVGLGHVAKLAGSDSAIGLDMGGTSSDVSRFEGHVGRRYESRVAGIRVMTPMMDIETVAAGGGSICEFSPEGRLAVGPASAGADPGPACYGRGGPLTITDINLLLGRIPEQRFPFPLQRAAAERRLEEIKQQVQAQRGSADQSESLSSTSTSVSERLSEGFLNIAVTHMAEAVRTVSTAQGTDVRQMSLVGFGGAAGQHLCRVAAALGISRVLDHPDAGVLSALGMGLADVGRVVTTGIYRPLPDYDPSSFQQTMDDLRRQADDLLAEEHSGEIAIEYRYECDLRYVGTESPLTLIVEPVATLDARFHQLHHETFGYAQRQRAIELVAIRCEATLRSQGHVQVDANTDVESIELSASDFPNTPLWHGDQWVTACLIDRDQLRRGHRFAGPAMVAGKHSTLVVEPGWSAEVIGEGTIEVRPIEQAEVKAAALARDADDLVLTEVVARRLQGIADAMGEVLRRTSISVNVKERRDYSCAVFRGDGSLIANAPHVPVHLGAMGHTVRHLASVFPKMSPGDCYLSNDPFSGGSHLPDVTAVTPVFCSDRGQPDFFVASRAHHAEIGGRTPGSMPPDATSLAEEGVLIRDFALVRGGQSHTEALRELLSSSPFPSRCVEENLADVAAQQAAGVYGARAVRELASQYSPATIDALMGRILDLAAHAVGHWIATLPEQPQTFSDSLDDGTRIAVTLQRQFDRLQIDFETGPVHDHGFNATPAIVTAAVLYVLRCVSQSDLPLCDGVLRQVDINIPTGLLDPPRHEDPYQCAAVVAGNVETSQRIVDVLLGAIGTAAASQGTMNNVLIGDDSFGYYETIAGGSGATEGHSGADAVHTHMTNTRITDPEVLESRLPVRLRQFRIRRGSGGGGRFVGGNGIIREFEFLKPLIVSLITSRRRSAPYGAGGGKAGKPGLNRWIHGGQSDDLPPTATIEVEAGDRLRIETPGGGGWGAP